MLNSITRTCGECDWLSPSRACVLIIRGMMDGQAWPLVNQPRQCLGFMPLKESYDNRTGRELWPELVAFEEHGGGVTGFLASELIRGPVPAAEIISRARIAGVTMRSIQRAAEKLLIKRRKCRFSGGWIWSLPDCEGAKELQALQRKVKEPKC